MKDNKIWAFFGLVVSTIYLLNPTMGVFELLPDNLPWVGNLDEATATAILLWSIRTLRKPKDIKNGDNPR